MSKTITEDVTTDNPQGKAAPKQPAKTARAPSKARAASKKTTATRTASKKAAAAKDATKPKPSARKGAAASAQPKKNEKKTSVTTATRAVAKASSQVKEKPEEEDKPKIAPAPLRPALKVAKRAEANRDKNQTFKVKTKIVYPAHGVGYITEIEKQEIAGHTIELFVIDFEHEKMKLRVPVQKAAASGMRNLSKPEQIDSMMKLVEGKARVKRTMWSRRAQEYEAKINSGDLQAVSEVVRDLYRADDQPEQSYSERQLFEQARERLGREVAAVRRKSLDGAIKEIHQHLDKKEKAAG